MYDIVTTVGLLVGVSLFPVVNSEPRFRDMAAIQGRWVNVAAKLGEKERFDLEMPMLIKGNQLEHPLFEFGARIRVDPTISPKQMYFDVPTLGSFPSRFSMSYELTPMQLKIADKDGNWLLFKREAGK